MYVYSIYMYKAYAPVSWYVSGSNNSEEIIEEIIEEK